MSMRNPWLRLTFDSWTLGMEMSTVVGLRALALATGGPAAQAEANRMVQEKLSAGLELQARAMSGALGFGGVTTASRTLAHYRRKVRANRRRLLKA